MGDRNAREAAGNAALPLMKGPKKLEGLYTFISQSECRIGASRVETFDLRLQLRTSGAVNKRRINRRNLLRAVFVSGASFIIWLLVDPSAPRANAFDGQQPDSTVFEQVVRPFLARNCYPCHN